MSAELLAHSDFRVFLRELIGSKKRAGLFTGEKFAEKVGMSHSQLKMVLTGKRNITEEQLLRIASALNFSFEEKTYFEALVSENQAKSSEAKKFHSRRRKLAKQSIKVSGRSIAKEVSLDGWHVPALLIYLLDIEGIASKSIEEVDRDNIKKLFSLTDAQLDKSLSSFQTAGFLDIQRDGKVQVKLDGFGARLARQEFVSNVVDEARKRVRSDFGKPDTFFSADTISISKSQLRNFIEDYKDLVSTYIGKDLSETEPTKIVQLALQLFSVN